MANHDDRVPVISSALTDLIKGVESILEKAKATIKEVGAAEFAASKIGMLWSAMSLYATAFRKLECMTRSQMEDVIKKHFRSMEVQDHFDHLQEVEDDWNGLLTHLDHELNSSVKGDRLVVGGAGPQVNLTDVRTGEETTVQQYLDALHSSFQSEIDAANGRVIVLTFGVREGALKWLEDTKCPYPMLMDPERKVYDLMGLGKSVFKTWSIAALCYYAERVVEGRALPSPYGVKDDVHQMGGDLVLDNKGQVAYIHCCKTTTDRPPVNLILKYLKGPNQESL